MSRVFVVNNAAHDYSVAEKFGKVIFVTEGKIPIFKTDIMIAALTEGFMDFKDTDYVLVSGPAWVCMITTILLFKRFEEIKFLIFDAKERAYVVRHLNKESL